MGETTQDKVQRWFRVRRRQLLDAAELPVCDHSGLAGSHREEFQRVYLSEILPRRFKVGRGMVYGVMHRSREADIVIWDADNYPSLPMMDHQFFFAESVRAVIEAKSRFRSEDFHDVLDKSRAVRDIVVTPQSGLEDEIIHLKLQMYALMQKDGSQSEGFLRAPHHVATAAVFLRGGSTFSLADLDTDIMAGADDSFPDLVLFLEPGIVLVKNYGEEPALLRFTVGDDCLAFWTDMLLDLVLVRAASAEPLLNLAVYLPFEMSNIEPDESRGFRLTRWVPGRTPIFSAAPTSEQSEGD